MGSSHTNLFQNLVLIIVCHVEKGILLKEKLCVGIGLLLHQEVLTEEAGLLVGDFGTWPGVYHACVAKQPHEPHLDIATSKYM